MPAPVNARPIASRPPLPPAFPTAAAALFCLTLLVGCAASSETPAVRNVHTVTAGTLVRGAQPDEAGLRALTEKYGVRTVVNFNDRTTASERATAERLGLNYVAAPTSPFHPEEAKVLAFLAAVRDAGQTGPVYVHCKDGMDRTGVAVAAYRILMCDWDAKRALSEMKEHQSTPHAMTFRDLPNMVRGIERDRERWLARLAITPDPIGGRPAGATVTLPAKPTGAR